MIPLKASMLPVAVAVAGAAFVGGGVGFFVAGELAEKRLAKAEARSAACEQARAEEARRAAEGAARLLAQAQDAEGRAARALADRRRISAQKLEEARRHAYAIRFGNDCLPADVRMRINAAIAAAGDVSAPAGGAVDGVAAVAANTGERDDSSTGAADAADVARWAVEAVERYEECRSRIDALRKWDEMTFTPPVR